MSTATATNGRSARAPRALVPVEQAPGAQLAAAVLAVQAKASKLVRNAQGQIGPRHYGYVTLDAIVDEVLPLLVEEELLWRCFPTRDQDGAPALRYRMTHVPSGELDEDLLPLLGCTDSQAIGSAITYGRRYALTAYLNLTVDPDDDGLAASHVQSTASPGTVSGGGKGSAPAPGATAIEPRRPQAAAPKPSERAITANQRTKLLVPRAQKAGLSDGQFANVLLGAAGEPPRTWRTEEHAAQTLDRLLDRFPARLKDAALEGIDAAQVAKTGGSGKR